MTRRTPKQIQVVRGPVSVQVLPEACVICGLKGTERLQINYDIGSAKRFYCDGCWELCRYRRTGRTTKALLHALEFNAIFVVLNERNGRMATDLIAKAAARGQTKAVIKRINEARNGSTSLIIETARNVLHRLNLCSRALVLDHTVWEFADKDTIDALMKDYEFVLPFAEPIDWRPTETIPEDYYHDV